MAPSNPARTMASPSLPFGAAMMPEPTVAATLVETRAPRTFMIAAMASATRGVKAWVEMLVAASAAA